MLFNTSRNNITLHIGNIFKEGELDKDSVCKESLLTAADGKVYKTNFYNLDVIISVGYRVKTIVGTKFRQWANKVINCGHSLKDTGNKLSCIDVITSISADVVLNYVR